MTISSFHITDRRKNPGGKNLNNRKRFIERVKQNIDLSKGLKKRGIGDQSEEDVTISRDGIEEPQFQYDRDGGIWDHILPGNKEYNVGDRISRPRGGQGGGGTEGSPDGEGEDDFRFALSREEYFDVLFGDLELPDMIKDTEKHIMSWTMRRAGYTPVGPASNLALEQSMIKSISRRLALKKPKLLLIEELEAELENETDEKLRLELEERIAELRERADAIPFLDKTDLRYHNTVKVPLPITQAVMYCVDGETEYLTRNGWQKISAYNGEDVAQYNKDGSITFVNKFNHKYVKNNYDSDFLRIKAQGIDQLITPEHRVIYKNTSGKLAEMSGAELELRHNQTAFGFRGKFITHFSYENGDGLNLTDNEIMFHVAFKADGTYQRDHTNRAQFIFHKKRKMDRLVAILKNLGWEFAISEGGFNPTDYDVYRVYVTTPNHIEKRYGKEWYNATRDQRDLISEEVLHWDGTRSRGRFSAEHKSDCDYIQFVWASLGYGTDVSFASGVWIVSRCSFNERSLTSKKPVQITRMMSDDKHSYCFSVPSGMLVLRRNNEIFVTGNCLMDVSGSMTEHMKDLAKRFYILLYIFLTRIYKDVEVVFIRHTHEASIVDEDTFFHDPETGGTVVSTAYDVMRKDIIERFPVDEWNIYGAQCSDGDNTASDNENSKGRLAELLPWMQYLAYIEVTRDEQHFPPGFIRRESDLWQGVMKPMQEVYPNKIAMRKMGNKNQVVEIFRSLFVKKGPEAEK